MIVFVIANPGGVCIAETKRPLSLNPICQFSRIWRLFLSVMRRLATQAFFIVLLTLSWQVTTQASYTNVSTRLGAVELSDGTGWERALLEQALLEQALLEQPCWSRPCWDLAQASVGADFPGMAGSDHFQPLPDWILPAL